MQDVESSSGGLYATSGLLASSDFFSAPKASFYHYAAMMAWVSNYTFVADVELGPSAPGAMAACFKSTNATTGALSHALIVWSPTANATVLRDASVPVSGDACPVASPSSSVYSVVPMEPLVRGNVSTVSVDSSGIAIISISEMPTLILRAATEVD